MNNTAESQIMDVNSGRFYTHLELKMLLEIKKKEQREVRKVSLQKDKIIKKQLKFDFLEAG